MMAAEVTRDETVLMGVIERLWRENEQLQIDIATIEQHAAILDGRCDALTAILRHILTGTDNVPPALREQARMLLRPAPPSDKEAS